MLYIRKETKVLLLLLLLMCEALGYPTGFRNCACVCPVSREGGSNLFGDHTASIDSNRLKPVGRQREYIMHKVLQAIRKPTINMGKGTPGSIHCQFKVASLATLNKQMLSSLATYDALSLVNHKAQLNLVWVHMVDICPALINSWQRRGHLHFLCL